MNFAEYLAKCMEIIEVNEHDWRKGQTYFNVLVNVRPDLADKVRGSLIDPFHDDMMLPAFFDFVSERWT